MAEKVKTKKATEPTAVNKLVTILKDEKTVFISGFFLLLFSSFLFLSMLSYLFTWKTDNIEWLSMFSSSDIIVDNWGGKLGAALANKFIYSWFGLPSYAFVFLFIITGLNFIGVKIFKLSTTIRYTILGIVWFSLALGIVDNFLYNQEFLLGGAYGFFISKWLVSFLGNFGTILLLLVALFAFIILTFDNIFIAIKVSLGLIKREQNDNSLMEDEKKLNNEKNESVDEISIDDVKEEKTEESDKKIIELETESIIKEDELIKEEVSNDFEVNSTLDKEDILINENEDIEPKEIETEEEEGEFVVERKEEEEIDEKSILITPEGDFDPTLDLSFYKMPLPEYLEDHHAGNSEVSQDELNANKDKIIKTLEDYKIKIDKIKATIGPTITLYEIVPAAGVRISKIKNLEDDIALSLAALGIRIIAPMPGRGTVGIEVPNEKPEIVSMKKVILSKAFQESKFELPVVLGKTISNDTFVFDLAKAPHMLVAGATGQGKSVGINAILTSLLYKKHPAQLKFILVDPKQVELSIYSKIEKHYLAKLPEEEEAIITDTQKVVKTLNSLTVEMDNRYKMLKSVEARNIIEYNNKFVKRQLNPNKGHKFLPYIVLVIDEFADLIMTAGKEVETPIARIAQLARAVGIHMIIATQRPSTNIITGIIKANFPTRVAFRVTSMVDSRTILDSPGANHLIGRGDMLISQGSDLIRVQCAFVDTPEVDKITKHISEQQGYATAFLLPEVDDAGESGIGEVDLKQRDQLFEDAARLVVGSQQGSTSSIQRKFSIGYNRAGRIMDQLEAAGIVGPFEGSKARKVLFPDEYSLEQYLNSMN